MSNESNNEIKLSFFIDTLNLIRDNAIEARNDSLNNTDDDFKRGISFCYYELFHLMEQQALSFSTSFKELGINGIDPDKDLLGLEKKP